MIPSELVAEIVQEHEPWLNQLEGLAIEAIATHNWSPVLEHLNSFMAWQDAQAHEAQKANTADLSHPGAGLVPNAQNDRTF